MASAMSNSYLFIAVLLFMSDLLSCLDTPYSPICRNAAQKVFDGIQSRTEDMMFIGTTDPVNVNLKYSLGKLPSPISEFCGTSGGLDPIMGVPLDPANVIAFSIDVIQETGYGSAVLQLNRAWLQDIGHDNQPSITILYCQSSANGQPQLMRKPVGNLRSSTPGSPDKAAKIGYILDGSDKVRPIPVLVVLQGIGISSKNHPNNTYPFIEMRTTPKVVQPRNTWSSICHALNLNPCCLDVVDLDVKTQLATTKLGQLSIVEPQTLKVHFCRPNPNADPPRPAGSPKCCVPSGFNLINVVSEDDATGLLSRIQLDNIDAKGCSCT